MQLDKNIPEKLAIAVCCHFNEARLPYLNQISDDFASLGSEVFVIIVTNTSNANEIKKLESVIAGKGFSYEFFIPDTLGHPLLLTWLTSPYLKHSLRMGPLLTLCI